jgi:hypothetical protein
LEIKELPESIGELESLETLDIRRCGSTLVLPVSLAKLRNLVRLFADGVKLPDGLTLENMTSLQQLVGIYVTLHAVTEIGKLRELKVLGLLIPEDVFQSHRLPTSPMETNNKFIVKCLQLCHSLQVLSIKKSCGVHFCTADFMKQLPSEL